MSNHIHTLWACILGKIYDQLKRHGFYLDNTMQSNQILRRDLTMYDFTMLLLRLSMLRQNTNVDELLEHLVFSFRQISLLFPLNGVQNHGMCSKMSILLRDYQIFVKR